VWFTHNDSGDSARFFAVGANGTTLATYDVDNASAVDWEDMAAAPRAGKPTLWLADIGDNDARRSTVSVYAVPEPVVRRDRHGVVVHVRAVRYRFRYPGGPRNAESIFVDPRTARIYLASTEVYVAPAHPSPTAVSTLTRLGSVQWTPGAGGLLELPLELATTGGAFAPDGRSFVLRTYTDAYVFRLSGTGPAAVKAALASTPRRVTLPDQPQGEGVAYRRDGKALVLSSEGKGSAVLQVALAPASSAAASTTSSAAGATSVSPSASASASGSPPAASATPAPPPSRAASPSGRGGTTPRWVAAGAALTAALAVAVLAVRRLARRP
jgi:hypothetical protein